MHFLKISHLVVTILIIFLRINWPHLVHLSAKPLKARGPRLWSRCLGLLAVLKWANVVQFLITRWLKCFQLQGASTSDPLTPCPRYRLALHALSITSFLKPPPLKVWIRPWILKSKYRGFVAFCTFLHILVHISRVNCAEMAGVTVKIYVQC